MRHIFWRDRNALVMQTLGNGVLLHFVSKKEGGKFEFNNGTYFMLSPSEAGLIASLYHSLLDGKKIKFDLYHDASKSSRAKSDSVKVVRVVTDPEKKLVYLGLFLGKDKKAGALSLTLGDMFVFKTFVELALKDVFDAEDTRDNSVENETEPPEDDMPF